MKECIKQRQKCLGVQQQLQLQKQRAAIKNEVENKSTSVVVLTNDKDKDISMDLQKSSSDSVFCGHNDGVKNVHWQKNKLTASSSSAAGAAELSFYWNIKRATMEQCCTAMLWLVHNKKPYQQDNQLLTPMHSKSSYYSANCNVVTHFLLRYCLIFRREQHFEHENCVKKKCCEKKKQQQQQIKSISFNNNNTTTTTMKTTTTKTTITTTETERANSMNRNTGKMHATKTKIIIYHCRCLRALFHRRCTRTKYKSLLLILQLGNVCCDGYGGNEKNYNGAIRKIRIMTSDAAQYEKLLYKKAAPMCLLGINIASAAITQTNYLLLRRFVRSKALKMRYITNKIALMKLSKELKRMNKCTKYHHAHNNFYVHHQQHHIFTPTTIISTPTPPPYPPLSFSNTTLNSISNRNTSFNFLSSHVYLKTPQKAQQEQQLLSANKIKTTTHSLYIFNAENHQHKSSSLLSSSLLLLLSSPLSSSTLATCNQNNGADNFFLHVCNNNNSSLLCSNITNFRAFKSKLSQAAAAENVDDDQVEDEEEVKKEAKTNNKKEKYLSVNIKKKNWKVAAFQPLCSFILFIEKQTRKERNVLTNIFYKTTTNTNTTPTTNIISKCNHHLNNNNNNNNNKNNNINNNSINSNNKQQNFFNNNSNYNKYSGGQPSPKIQRLNSQRDDDTSKYNRENCRFLKHSNNKLNNFNKNNNENIHYLNNHCKENNNTNIQQQLQINSNNNNNNNKKNEKHIYNNFIKVNDVDIKITNNLYEFQQKHQQIPDLQTTVNQQKHYSTKILEDEDDKILHITSRQQRNIPLSSYSSRQRRQQLINFPQKLRNFLMNNLTTTYLKYFYILLTFVYFTTTIAAVHADNFHNTFVNSLNAIKTTNTMPSVSLANNEVTCRSLDLRNEPSDFRQLENCTVIEGFLLISVVNTNAQTEFNETYPLLREVSEFIIVYRINLLRSLAQIFPNLSIIRGRKLFEGYALTIYNNPHLEELGLTKLIAISRGAVRIEENYALCFVNTVDWELITNSKENIIRKNSPLSDCPLCPGDHKGTDISMDKEFTCKQNLTTGKRNCWNSNNCQKICPPQCHDNCIDENTCCNEACIGGCSPNDPNTCVSCRNFSMNNSTCIDKCPPTYFNYIDRRCITAENCAGIGTKFENNKPETLIAYEGNCTTSCPKGYGKVNSTCVKCGDKCIKTCKGGLIDTVSHAKAMFGCTHIISDGLTISIKRGGRFLMEDLEYGLSSIQVIDNYLKVHLTYGIFSLEFFKNLRLIKGEVLYENNFSLYVLENSDLEHIWAKDQVVRLENGRVFFHFNPKLCFAKIQELLPMMRNNKTFENSEVASDSNGSKGSCNTYKLNTRLYLVTSQTATVEILNPIKFEDERTFIGYIYLYIEDKIGNATKHGYRPCEDGWSQSNPTKELTNIFGGLSPYTQYAYYVKTMTISMVTQNAQSEIAHFTTKAHKPLPVSYIHVYANSSSEIVLTWKPPITVNGKLQKYQIFATISPMMSSQKESVNYCKTPLQNAVDAEREYDRKEAAEKVENAENCVCASGEKTGTKPRDEETDSTIISESMSFENAIQNFVYVKQKSNKSSSDEETKSNRRKRRSKYSLEIDEMTTTDSFLLRHVRSASNRTEPFGSNTTNNLTTLDTTNSYYENFVAYVDANTTQYVFKMLKHFTIYDLKVVACREPEQGDQYSTCSNEKVKQMRTLKLDDVDVIEDLKAELEISNNTRNSVRLHWKPPTNPNGMVVSYTIAYQLLTEDAVEEKRCITEQNYNKLEGYLIPNLGIGNHSIRVRANTQAGDGIFSEPKYVEIPPVPISKTVIAIIVGTILTFLAMIGGFIYYLRKKLLTTPSDLKMYPSVNPYYISLQYIPDDWEVSRERVIQLSPLGQGSFGMVYEGILKGLNEDDEDQSCAVKTVNENATDRERMNFLNEASVMKQFDTYHVVRLLGVCSRGQPALVIMELMKNGDLKSYLRAHRPDEREDGINGYMLPQHEQLGTSVGASGSGGGTLFQPPPLSRLYQMALEIADGMAYLSAKKFVHRDLAARNCMVAADLTVKIGDFGMTRDIYETDYYRKGTKGLLPVRWMPPESLRDGVYSSASDVFSYGVVLWEMATLASQPYQGLSNDQVLRYVIDGGVMERPENCPDKLYRLMQKCWHHRPSARPTFMDIITHLADQAHTTFRQVSFYYSEEGEQMRQKELADKMHNSDDAFTDKEIEMDDVTTPLRVGEYNEYKMNMENNSSIENHDGSPMGMEDEPQNLAYSLGADINASSTPEGNLQGVGLNLKSYTPKILPVHEGYVQSYSSNQKGSTSNPIDIVIQKSRDNEERGYEVYDPSPQYQHPRLNDDDNQQHHGHDDDDDGGGGDGDYGSSSVDARMLGERLLPRKKRNQRGKSGIIIRPMSNSMPDEVGGITISSSLHPSTASAASSNASSTATGTGKYPSLKKTVTDTMQNVGYNLRNINKRLFSHKRTGSTGSHKSINLQPTIDDPGSISNKPSTPITDMIGSQQQQQQQQQKQQQPQPKQNLATIESGGSGSAGSYCMSPRFFTAAAGASDNPNYQPYDVTKAAEGKPTKANQAANVNYQLMGAAGDIEASENPNYEIMQSPIATTMSHQNRPLNEILDIKNVHISENPNYQVTGPPETKNRESFLNIKMTSSSASISSSETEMKTDLNKKKTATTKKQRNLKNRSKQKQTQQQSQQQKQQQIRMEEINITPTAITELTPLTQVTVPTAAAATTTTSSTIATASIPLSKFSLKEKWLRQQQQNQQQQPPPPQQSHLSTPPNGFIG